MSGGAHVRLWTTSAGRRARTATPGEGVSLVLVRWLPDPGEPMLLWPAADDQLRVAHQAARYLNALAPDAPPTLRSEVDRDRIRLVARAPIHVLLRAIEAAEHADLDTALDICRAIGTPRGWTPLEPSTCRGGPSSEDEQTFDQAPAGGHHDA